MIIKQKKTNIEKYRLWWNHRYKFHVIDTKLFQLASRPMQPTSGIGTVALHSTDCIHFLIICCISLMDGILQCSFSNLVPRGTNKTEAYYSRPRPRPRHQGLRPRQWKLHLEECLEAPHHGSGINCIGADANIGASALALGTADVPATHCCHQTQWRPAGSHMAVNYL